jgi:LemA protein
MMKDRLLNGALTLWRALSLFAIVLAATSCQRYDVLVDKDQLAAEKWSNLEAQLERRADLVPNLVSVVKGAARYEQETLTKVTEARSQLTKVTLSADDLSDPEKMAAF